MKEYMMHRPHYDVDYCMYSDFGYKKRTRIWTNLEGFEPKLCNGNCGNMVNGKHACNMGCSKVVIDNGKRINVKSKELREKYKDFENIQPTLKGCNKIGERYRIPFKLIKELFDLI